MKKIFLIYILAFLVFSLSITSSAAEYNVTDNDDGNVYDYNSYIPSEVKDILLQNGIEDVSKIDFSSIISVFILYTKNAVSNYSKNIVTIFVIIFLTSIFSVFNDNTNTLLIVNVIPALLISLCLFDVFSQIINNLSNFYSSCSEALSVALPFFITVSAMSGATMTGAAIATSTSAVLLFSKTLLSEVGITVLKVAFVFLLLESIAPQLSNGKISTTLKRHTISLVLFISMIFLTVISLQGVISARSDSLSIRSVKFASSSFVPIIGGALGESLRTVLSGIDFIRSSLGAAVVFALIFLVLPLIVELFALKILIGFSSFCAASYSSLQINKMLDGFCDVLDISLSILISVSLLSITPALIFAVISFA